MKHLEILLHLFSSVIDSRTVSPAASYQSRRGRKPAPVFEKRNRVTARSGALPAPADSRGDHRTLALAQSLSSLAVQEGGGGDERKNGALHHEPVVASRLDNNIGVLPAGAVDASSQSGRGSKMESVSGNQSGSGSLGSQPRAGSAQSRQPESRSGSTAKGKEIYMSAR